jgi:hypothetical protein
MEMKMCLYDLSAADIFRRVAEIRAKLVDEEQKIKISHDRCAQISICQAKRRSEKITASWSVESCM